MLTEKSSRHNIVAMSGATTKAYSKVLPCIYLLIEHGEIIDRIDDYMCRAIILQKNKKRYTLP